MTPRFPVSPAAMRDYSSMPSQLPTMALLQVHRLTKRIGRRLVVEEASFEVTAGETHALVGPEAVGKSAVIDMICGALTPDLGVICLDGEDLGPMPVAARVAAGLGRSFQSPRLCGRFTVLDNAVLAVLAGRPGTAPWWRPARADEAAYADAEAMLALVGLMADGDRVARELDPESVRRLELALALATRPRLLLLDDPLGGLAPDAASRVIALLAALKAQRLTLLIAAREGDPVLRLADRVTALARPDPTTRSTTT